ncbi:acetylxylan esterase [Streptomyces sp. NPDC057963]|uniref:acetylxylan esterase n=1 Tax=Streptomyces sp. NPDC057963 TaxID=3346290 RepID=UPI0036E77DF9
MPLTDLPLADCRTYRPDLPVPAGFDAFWSDTLSQVTAGGQDPVEKPVYTPVDTGLPQIRTYDVTLSGFAGRPVRGWLRLPAAAIEPLGCVVEFLGYGRGRGLAHENLLWASAGHAHLVMDTRGQGWSAAEGATADTDAGAAGAVPGFLTCGIESPETYYYRRVFTDAVRCVEAMRTHPEVDPGRIVVTGVSQGGGIALAVFGLVPGLAGVMPDVPFLCNFRRAAEISGLPPYTCFTAYNHYAGPKDVRVYPFNGHEGGAAYQQREQLAWVRSLFAGPPPGLAGHWSARMQPPRDTATPACSSTA